jgi:hypothetical protein
MTRLLLVAALLSPLAAAASEPIKAPPAKGATARAAEAPTAKPSTAAAPAARAAPGTPGALVGLAAVRFGMTEDEVLRAAPVVARKLDPPEKLADGRVVAVGIESHQLEGLELRARFVFEGGRLDLVSLKSLPTRNDKVADYERLRDRLTARLAVDGTEARDDSATDYRHTRWQRPEATVDLKFIPGTIVVQVSPPQRAPAAVTK